MKKHKLLVLGLWFVVLLARSAPAAPREVKADTTTKALIFPTETQFKTANHLAIGTDVQAANSRLTTLAASSQIDLFLANPVVLGAVPLKLDALKISRSGGSDVVIQQGLGSSAEVDELWVSSSASGANVMKLKNGNAAGFSALAFADNSAAEKLAVGYGNGSALHGFGGWGYVEMSDADGGGSAPGLGIWQSTTYAGALSYEHHPRIGLLENGDFLILERSAPAGNPSGDAGVSLFYFDGQTPVLTLGNVNGTNGYADIRGLDANHAIVLREGLGNTNTFYSFGGTGATKGHIFKTGGARGSQTQRLQVADDGVRIGSSTTTGTPIAKLRHGVATLVAGTVTVSDTSVTTSSRIFVTMQSLGTVAAPKALGVTARTASTSFTITSADATDTSVVAWELIEP